jgi:murein L,D-transpeptidase YcbB/YkuD
LRGQLQSANARYVKQLNTSLNFYRWIHHFNFEKFIVVNIPAAQMRYYEQDNLRLEMKAVVGKPKTRTPRFTTYCYQVVLYPYWNVPNSIAVNELIPKFRKKPSAIDAMDIKVVDSKGQVINHYDIDWASVDAATFPYKFRQATGCDNSLGVIKFDLTDDFNVYMHDTNYKAAFESMSRYLSHGCIRLEKPIDLANILLNNKLDEDFVKACIRNQKPVYNKIKPVPVFVIYNTAVAKGDSVSYLKDIYGLN